MCEGALWVRGELHSLRCTGRTLVCDALSLSVQLPVAIDEERPSILRHQDISLLNRFTDDLVYVWLGCSRTNLMTVMMLLAFKIDVDVNPTTAKLLYSVPLGGPVLGLTCCDTAHGRSSCVIFHSISADRSQVISESLDMRLVLRFAEKVRREGATEDPAPAKSPGLALDLPTDLRDVSHAGFRFHSTAEVWGASMDYHRADSIFSFSVQCTVQTATQTFVLAKTLLSAQQVAVNAVVSAGAAALDSFLAVQFRSSDRVSSLTPEGHVASVEPVSHPLWQVCESLQMARPDRWEVMCAARRELSTAEGGAAAYRWLLVTEMCLTAGAAHVMAARMMHHACTTERAHLLKFLLGRQDGVHLGLLPYLEAHAGNVLEYLVHLLHCHRAAAGQSPAQHVSGLPLSIPAQLCSDLMMATGVHTCIESLGIRGLDSQHSCPQLIKTIRLVLALSQGGGLALRSSPGHACPPYVARHMMLPERTLCELWIGDVCPSPEGVMSYPPVDKEEVVALLTLPLRCGALAAQSAWLLIAFFVLDCCHAADELAASQRAMSSAPLKVDKFVALMCRLIDVPRLSESALLLLWRIHTGLKPHPDLEPELTHAGWDVDGRVADVALRLLINAEHFALADKLCRVAACPVDVLLRGACFVLRSPRHYTSSWLQYIRENRDELERLPEKRKSLSVFVLDWAYGHDALGALVDAVLEQQEADVLKDFLRSKAQTQTRL